MTCRRLFLLVVDGGIALAILGGLALTILCGIALAPEPAAAGAFGTARGGGRGGGRPGPGFVQRSPGFVHRSPGFVHRGPSVFPTVVDPWRFWGVNVDRRHFPGHRFDGGRFASPYVATPSVVTSYVTSAPVYPTSIVVVAPPAAEAPQAPAPPSTPSVIDYPSGRYELRGDGINTPYVWVWIPKPPPPPAAPPAPDAAPVPSGGSTGLEDLRSAPRVGEIYRWTDEQGVTTWTDRLNKVPERFRSQALTDTAPK